MKEIRLTDSEKILLLSTEYPPGPGGIGNHAHNLARFLNLSGIKTDVLTVSDYVTEEEAMAFDKSQPFCIQRHKRYPSRLKTYSERLSEIKSKAENGNYGAVIFSGSSALLASLAIKKNGMKFISIAHGGEVNVKSPLRNYLLGKSLAKSDLVVPVSGFTASMISAEYDKRKCTVIPNGYDFENETVSEHERKAPENGNLKLVTVGTVWPRKGHHNVIRALPELRKHYPHVVYNVIGRKADMSKVNEVITDELKSVITFHGQLERPRLVELLRDSDVFIILSELQQSGDFEGFGIAAIEANSFGLPAVGSKNSGLEDAIKHGESGMLVDQNDPRDISDAVRKITEDYGRFSKGASDWAREHHWSRIIRRYIEALNSLN